MSEDFSHELQAITAIYGDDILQKLAGDGLHIYALSLKQHHVTLRMCFPPGYPAAAPPELQGTESVESTVPKGHGLHILTTARRILNAIFVPGQVCLFDLLQALEEELVPPIEIGEIADKNDEEGKDGKGSNRPVSTSTSSASLLTIQKTTTSIPNKTNLPSSASSSSSLPPASEHIPPTWLLSTTITEKKSIFLARACTVTSPDHAQSCIAHLIATDRRAAKATHNITAYRIRNPSATTRGTSDLTFQDCDDDGESAAGSRVLHLLQVMEAWGVLVVVSRWFGGVKLGPDRFRIINQVVREVVVKGGWGKGGS